MNKCVIIEDERPAQRLLQSYIEKSRCLELTATYGSALEVEGTSIEDCDILFLDIKLPKIAGLEFLRTLTSVPEVIITTAFPDYAVDAFELEIVDYLLKPYSFERFMKAVHKAEEFIRLKSSAPVAPARDHLFIYADKAFYRVEKNEILFVKSEGDYVQVHTLKDKWLLNDTLKNWTEKLQGHGFVRIHQSYLVSLSKVDKVQGNRLFVGEWELPISRLQRAGLMDLLVDRAKDDLG